MLGHFIPYLFFATSPNRNELEFFISHVFGGIATVFCRDDGKPGFHFIIRGAIAFGEIYFGKDLEMGASRTLDSNPEYKSQILLGKPIVFAFESEHKAPPFGVAIHESARQEAPEGESPFVSEWWKWSESDENLCKLFACLKKYYAWCRKDKSMNYDETRINFHETLADRYFSS